MRRKSQKEQILQYMQLTGGITTKEAWDNIGCSRLSGRIYELIHEDGYDIKVEMVKVPGRHGTKARVARYSLDE